MIWKSAKYDTDSHSYKEQADITFVIIRILKGRSFLLLNTCFVYSLSRWNTIIIITFDTDRVSSPNHDQTKSFFNTLNSLVSKTKPFHYLPYVLGSSCSLSQSGSLSIASKDLARIPQLLSNFNHLRATCKRTVIDTHTYLVVKFACGIFVWFCVGTIVLKFVVSLNKKKINDCFLVLLLFLGCLHSLGIYK